MRYTLKETTKNPKDGEGVLLYVGDDGSTFKFQCHPTKAFQFLIYPSSTAPKKVQDKLLDAWVTAGIHQHDYAGGYHEAISVLNV